MSRPSLRDLAVVIVTYNSARTLRACLIPLVAVVEAGGEVVIVDNGSEDETISVISEVDRRFQVLENPGNPGYADAVNKGVGAAQRDYICLLNPDVVAGAGDFVVLIDSLQRDRSVGVVAPTVMQGEPPSRVSASGLMPTTWRMFTYLSGLSWLAGPRWLEGFMLLQRQCSARREVEWASGACLVVAKSFWVEIGGMCERWFMYGEDVELGWRVRERGYKIILEPSVRVAHALGQGSSARDDQLDFVWIQNLDEFMRWRIGTSWPGLLCWRGVVAGGLLARASLNFLRGLSPAQRRKRVTVARGYVYAAGQLLRAPMASIH